MSLTPKSNPQLLGHEALESLLLADLASGKMAHGIILSGPRGIGKATLAYRFARMLLAGQTGDMDIAETNPVFARVAAGSHADLLIIEQLFDTKKDELAREISAEQARTIPEALSFTPGEGAWRVVIIDSADALNNSAANAILKILEEPPPQTILLLVSHNAGRLLPTIRSRCRTYTVKPLLRADFNRVIRIVEPELYGDELSTLAMLSNNSPGVALELHEQGALDIFNEVLGIVSTLPQLDLLRLHRFADYITTGKTHTNWVLFSQMMLCLLERAAKTATGLVMEPVNEEEGEALRILAGLHDAGGWAVKWQQAAEQFLLAETRHLDYKQVVLAFFHSLAGNDEFVIGTAA